MLIFFPQAFSAYHMICFCVAIFATYFFNSWKFTELTETIIPMTSDLVIKG